MSMKRGIVRGAFSLGGARIATNLLNAATLLILARLLTPEDFGVAAIAAAVLHFVLSLTQFSIYQALVQRDDATSEHIDTAWTISLIRTLLLLAFFIAAAWPLSIAYDDPDMIPVFIVTGLTGAVTGVFNPHMNLATKQMRFGPLTVFQICQKGAGLVVAIVLAIFFQSYWSIIIGNFVGAASATLLSYKLIPYRPRFTLSRFRDIWNFSGWMFLNQLCETVNWRFDQLAASIAVPKAQMGLYAMADSLAVIPSRETIQPLREALFPGLANLTSDRGKLITATLQAQATIAMISMPLAIGLALVAEPAVKVVLGEQWSSVTAFVQIFSVTYAIGAITSCFPSTAMVLGQTRFNFLQQFWTMVFRIPLVVIGLVTGGLMGAAIGRFLSEIISGAVSLHYMRKLLQVSVRAQLLSHSSTLLALLAMTVAVMAAKPSVDAYFVNDLARLSVLVIVGAAGFGGSSITIWLAGGRKIGPLGDLISVAQTFIPARFMPGRAG